MPTSTVQHEIYLVRHGQCRGNVSGETLIPEEDVITETGKLQANALGEHLKSIQFTKVISSPYQRTVETTKGILEKLENPPSSELVIDPRVREREMGDYIGTHSRMVLVSVMKKMAETGKKFSEIDIPGGETAEEFVERKKSFFKELFEELKSSDKPQTVLIVSHGLVIRRFMAGLRDGTFADVCDVTNWSKAFIQIPENTCCSVFTTEFPEDAKPVLDFKKVLDTEHYNLLPGGRPAPHKHPHVAPEGRTKIMELVGKIPREHLEMELPECLPQ